MARQGHSNSEISLRDGAQVGKFDAFFGEKLSRIGRRPFASLGLGPDGWLDWWISSQGRVGQDTARKAACMVLNIVQEGRIDVICWASAERKNHYCFRHGADTGYRRDEVFSLSMSKMEVFRWSMGIRIKKKTELVEGAAIESQIDHGLAGATNPKKLTIKND
ncbi:hypothetical protein F5146DRAFT_230762 [Armillaria mellea]|nr:hypothetical protein F5146DRAFT_230762 [Armillaria mellea]